MHSVRREPSMHQVMEGKRRVRAKRDYQSEYLNYHSRPEQKKNRASRNSARRIAKKKFGGKVNSKDVHHKDGNPRNNSLGNLGVMSPSRNRSKK